MINRPSNKPDFKNNEFMDYEDTINKVLQIQKILTLNQSLDKQIDKKGINYMLEYIKILNLLDYDDKRITDEMIKKKIDNLYYKIFKNRRY